MRAVEGGLLRESQVLHKSSACAIALTYRYRNAPASQLREGVIEDRPQVLPRRPPFRTIACNVADHVHTVPLAIGNARHEFAFALPANPRRSTKIPVLIGPLRDPLDDFISDD